MASAGSPLEQVLLGMGLDLNPVKEAADVMKSVLTELNKLSDAFSTKATAADAAHLAAVKAAAQASVAAAAEAIAAEKKKQEVQETYRKMAQADLAQIKAQEAATVAAEKSKLAEIKLETAELEKQKALRASEIADIQKETAALRLKRAQEGGGGGAHSPTPGSTFASAVLGHGLYGALTGGAQFAVANMAIQQAVHWVEKFYDKLKEATVEASKLSQLSDVFDRLARGAGMDATHMLEGMQHATEGLVDKLTLTKVGIAGINSVAKLNQRQIVELTGDVVRLAEAHGGDAQQAMMRLHLALEKGSINARTLRLGIQQSELELRNLPPSMNSAERAAAKMAHALEVIHKRSLELGELPQTLHQMEQRLHVAADDMMKAFGKGFNESIGAQAAIRWIGEMTMKFNESGGAAEAFGRKIGDIMAVAAPAIMVVINLLRGLVDIFGALLESVGSLFGLISSNSGAEDNIRKLAHAFIYLNVGLGLVLEGIKEFVQDLGAMGNILKDVFTLMFSSPSKAQGNWEQLKKDILALPESFKKIGEDGLKTLQDRYGTILQDFDKSLDKARESLKHVRGTIDRPEIDSSMTIAQKAKLEDLKKQLQIVADKEALAQEKAHLDDFKRVEDEAYRDGLISLEQYEEDKRNIAKLGAEAKRKEIEADHAAQMEDLKNKNKLGMFIPGEFDLRSGAEIKKYNTQLIQVEEQLQKELDAIAAEGAKDRRATRAKAIEDALRMEVSRNQKEAQLYQERNRLEQEVNEKKFQKGERGPDEYFREQERLLAESAQRQMNDALKTQQIQSRAAQDLYDNAQVHNAANKQALTDKLAQYQMDADAKVAKAQMDHEKAVTMLVESEAQKRMEFVQKRFAPQQQALETRINYQQEGSPAQQKEVPQLLQELTGNLARQREALEDAIRSAEPYSDTWFQILDRIEQTYQAQVKYNAELKKMQDIVRPIADAFGEIGKGISSTFHSNFAQNLGSTISNAAAGAGQAKTWIDTIKGKDTTPKKSPEMMQLERDARDLFSGMRSSGNTVKSDFGNLSLAIKDTINWLHELTQNKPVTTGADEGLGPEGVPEGHGLPTDGSHEGDESEATGAAVTNSTKALEMFTGKVIAGAQALTSFAQTIFGSKSTMGGVLGGGLQGASFGMQVGGPIGAAIGAAVGATLGGIVGHKNAEVKKNVDEMNASFKDLMNEFQNNTNNLNNTILRLQGMVNQVQQMQSNSKKGHGDYQKLIDQYNDELTTLRRQQENILRNLKEELAILSAPVDTQGMLGDLKAIMEQYQKFEGAAQTTKDLADANQYLVQSLQNYELNLENQLAQDNQKAIEDALQLNDLIYQRQQLVQQYNQQVQSIMSQGVLTRTQTRAQSIGSQVEQLQVAFQRQMEQINEQISAAQFRVQSEQQIFSIATTRVGLEAQLLQLQNSQTSKDMTRIMALQSLVRQLQNGDWSSGALGQLLAGMQTVTNPLGGPAGSGETNLLQVLMGLADKVGQQGATQSLVDLITAAYEDRGTYGYADYRGQNM